MLHVLIPFVNGLIFPIILVEYLKVFTTGVSHLPVALALSVILFCFHLWKYRHREEHGRPRWAVYVEVLLPMAMFYPVFLLVALVSK